MKNLLTAYKVIATIVGVLLIVLCLIAFPLNHWGSGRPQEIGDWMSAYLGVGHGWLYMIYLIITFLLSRKARWETGFTVVTLVCGTIPIASFWAEHRVIQRTKPVA